MKTYNAITQAYLAANGLTRVKVRDAATGVEILRNVTQKELKSLQKSGRILTIT